MLRIKVYQERMPTGRVNQEKKYLLGLQKTSERQRNMLSHKGHLP